MVWSINIQQFLKMYVLAKVERDRDIILFYTTIHATMIKSNMGFSSKKKKVEKHELSKASLLSSTDINRDKMGLGRKRGVWWKTWVLSGKHRGNVFLTKI